jgi:hypothetical protein
MGGAELSLSEGSTSGWKAKLPKKAPFHLPKNRPFLEPLGRACLERLCMLYYKGSRLKGMWSSSEFETSRFTTVALLCEDGGLSQPRKLNQGSGYVR